jgi:hypothetical protein
MEEFISENPLDSKINDPGLPGGASPIGRPMEEFISENPQDSEINDPGLPGGD